MSHRILIGLFSVGIIVALSATDAAACGGIRKHLSAAEHARNEREIDVRRKVVQARNISGIDETLPKANLSASDRSKVKALRDRATKLSDAGKLDEADRVLREAWKTLGHPELYQVMVLLKC
jgi:hypothetical protein